MDIKVELSKNLKQKPDQSNLGFGNYFTDHMFIMDYTKGEGWHSARIVPYGNLSLDPAAMVFHYGQEVFEGMKAYKTKDERILLFRPEKNFERLNKSNERLCIPQINVQDAIEGLNALIKVEKNWIPTAEGTSLYIRPFIIATDAHLGVREANKYMFIIILSPVGAYYKEGLNPVKIFVETEYVRAVKGGTGFTKSGGNYAASLSGQVKAEKMNYSQVLWLDGRKRKYVEEVGTMNVFFKISGKVITPALEGSILPGITRMSSIEMMKTLGIPVEERNIEIAEIEEAASKGELEEAFGTGTAAVISPIGELNRDGNIMIINNGEIGPVAQKLYDELTGIQWGKTQDKFNWTFEVK